MSDKHLHIICFDVPYPVDYGGVFDVYFKIKALHAMGVSIHLHCFQYGRPAQDEALLPYCQTIHYYPRLTGWKGFESGLPYIVSSRNCPALLERLLADKYPILMEGIHCTYFLYTRQLPGERCFVRLHNVEHLYYQKLAQTTTNPFKKWYYRRESKLLQHFEAALANRATFWTMSQKDLGYFNQKLGYASIDNLPLYLPDYTPEWRGEKGAYCLYHGNLSVAENEYAAIYLLDQVFSQLHIPFVVAGKNPSRRLMRKAHAHQHTCLVANPSDRELTELIRKAQVNILPSFNSTGIKLKLINALYYGRHCLANTSAVAGSNLESCCVIADNYHSLLTEIPRLFDQPYTYYTYEHRLNLLNQKFNNQRNAAQMVGWIFGGEPTYPGYTAQRLRA